MRNCVICKAAFEEEAVAHLPDRKALERWTCGMVCQKRLEKRAAQRDEAAAELHTAIAEEAREPAVTEAERAREALGLEEVPEALPSSDATDPMEYALAAKHMVDAAAALSRPEDRYVVLELARGFVSRSVELLEGAAPADDEQLEDEPENVVVARAASTTKPGTSYTVSRQPNGSLVCDCAGFRHRQTCRHVAEAARRLQRGGR